LRTIALDEGLSRFRNDLEKEGFRVVDKSMVENADALVLSGVDDNFLDIQETATKKQIIDASGKSSAEIIKELKDFH